MGRQLAFTAHDCGKAIHIFSPAWPVLAEQGSFFFFLTRVFLVSGGADAAVVRTGVDRFGMRGALHGRGPGVYQRDGRGRD